MEKSKPKPIDRLRECGIYNPHMLATKALAEGVGVGAYITYTPAVHGRGFISARWQVVSVNGKTDPSAHWQDYGNKTFSVYRGDEKAAQMGAAMAWASERFEVEEWVKVPGLTGSLFPPEVAAWARALVKSDG